MRVLCLALLLVAGWCGAGEAAPNDEQGAKTAQTTAAESDEIELLRSRLATQEKLIDVLEGEVSRMEAVLKEKDSHIDLLQAQVDREKKVGKFQKSLNEFQEKQISKLREVVQELKALQEAGSDP